MFLWRISNYLDLTGFGAELSAGRGHTATECKQTVYLAEPPPLRSLKTSPTSAGIHASSTGTFLNPLHTNASPLQLDWARHIAYDKRLFQLSK